MAAVAAVSVVLVEIVAPRVAIRGRNILEPATVAILLGIALRGSGWVPATCGPGLRHYEVPLKGGIVLIGLALTLGELLRLGAQAFTTIVVCVAVAPAVIYLVTRRVGMTRTMSILLGVGTTICGTTAIALAAPVIGAKDEEVSYAVSTVSLFGAMAMIVLPFIAAGLTMDDLAFGVWAGLAVPSTPQVVATGSMYSATAGAQATVVKLVRNIFMIPTAFVLSLWSSRTTTPMAGRLSVRGLTSAMPGFVFGFLALSMLRSLVDASDVVPPDVWRAALGVAGTVAKALILIAMAGIGLNTRFQALRTLGVTPLLVGLFAATFLAIVSHVVVRLSGIGS